MRTVFEIIQDHLQRTGDDASWFRLLTDEEIEEYARKAEEEKE